MKYCENIKIVTYEDRFAADFARLNREWLEGFGLFEAADAKHLDHPRESIITPGGEIFVATQMDHVVGVCAILPVNATVVEIVKLAVTPKAQGQGIGRQLTQIAIEQARLIGAKRVILLSNILLTSALRLYESLGFQHKPLPPNLAYATANVFMELRLEG